MKPRRARAASIFPSPNWKPSCSSPSSGILLPVLYACASFGGPRNAKFFRTLTFGVNVFGFCTALPGIIFHADPPIPLSPAVIVVIHAFSLLILASFSPSAGKAPLAAGLGHDRSEDGPPPLDTPTEPRPINPSWAVHAYPLQQLTIRLQGTRHSDKAAIISQLEKVLARLKAGDVLGYEHDDDFGYSFEYVPASSEPSFFEESAGRK